jgi:molecular chaperone GrpE
MVNKNEEKKVDSTDFKEEDSSIDEKKEISVEDKLKETEEKLLRTLAELENQRRRFEKEVKDAFEYGGFSFAKETLATLDNLERAKIAIKNDESLKDNKDLDKFIKNIEIVEKDLVSIFEKNNIKKINSIKEKFNPNLHQAMLEIEDDNVEQGTIVKEIQAGYMFGERLLRPSFVAVAKEKKAEIDQKDNEKKTEIDQKDNEKQA